jgi:hypothetical protein
MWPFRRYPAEMKDSIVNKYSSELSKDILYSLRGNSPASSQLVLGNIKFMLIQVRDDDLSKLPEHIERALDITQRHQGIVDAVMASMLLITFELSESPAKNDLNCAELSSSLRRELGSNVRFLHGRKPCSFGTISTGQVITYGAYIPCFVEYLAELNKLTFGEDLEIR